MRRLVLIDPVKISGRGAEKTRDSGKGLGEFTEDGFGGPLSFFLGVGLYHDSFLSSNLTFP
jgi:hypothetical protein